MFQMDHGQTYILVDLEDYIQHIYNESILWVKLQRNNLIWRSLLLIQKLRKYFWDLYLQIIWEKGTSF